MHLPALLGQVVKGLQVLQPNSVFAIPKSHGTTGLIFLADNRPVTASQSPAADNLEL
ncbi:hypothetical protein LC609_26280 [Nostoc sp. XA013]|nr:hypothetical protein [Nostoc sp. XA013]